MKLTNARPGDVLERRGEHGEVVVVEVVNVFTASEPDSAGNVRCADYRANGGVGEMYRMRADQDPDVWTLVDACTECGSVGAWPVGNGARRAANRTGNWSSNVFRLVRVAVYEARRMVTVCSVWWLRKRAKRSGRRWRRQRGRSSCRAGRCCTYPNPPAAFGW